MTEIRQTNNVGLVAGWGRFPIIVAEHLKAAGYGVVCVGVKGHADPELVKICDQFQWFGMGRMGAQLRYFRRHSVSQATMAGKIFKTLLMKRFHLIRHLPDWQCMKHFYPMYISRKKDRKDDTMLETVTQLFGSGGVDFAPATDFAPELLVKAGVLTSRSPSKSQLADIQFAWQLAKAMGGLDVGQSVAVKGRAVLAVEAVEGTDACIRRAGELCHGNGFVIAKVAKPQQDMRFDVPTVGVSTLETMKAAGATVLAIEADKTILLDQPAFIAKANELKMVVVADQASVHALNDAA